MDERKSKLIQALRKERKRFEVDNMLTKDHDMAIEYLETGKDFGNFDEEEYQLLSAVIYDYNTVCSDYLS